MTQLPDFSGRFVSTGEAANRALVHVSADCRRGASGSIYNEDGLIVTTARAVAGRERVEVVQGARTTEGKVIGFDAATDIGLVQAETMSGSSPRWATEAVQLGTLVLAGSRPGRAARVRLGLVSQVGEAWHSPRGGRVERYVEIDFAIEPGFSGGLVFDVEGWAVGMSSAGLLRGVPLLLDKPTLDRVVAALLAHGRVRRGYLGVGTQAVRLPERAQTRGLLVSSVQPGSAAAGVGLMIGDVLLTLGGAELSDAGALQVALEDAEGRALPLTLLRGGQPLGVELTPGARS